MHHDVALFKKCSKVVEVAVKQNPKAVRFASESLREDHCLKQKSLLRISQDGCEKCLSIGIHWDPLGSMEHVEQLLEMSSAGRRVCQGSC